MIFAVAFGIPQSAAPAEATDAIRLYVFAGQSNMVGAATVASDLPLVAPASVVPSSDVIFWGPIADAPVAWHPLEAPTEVMQPTSHQGFGPEIGAGRVLARRHPNSTIAIVKLAVGGTSLQRDWNPDRAGGLYRRLIGRVRTAMAELEADRPVHISGFFWMQGESDSSDIAAARAYEGNLQALIRAVRNDLRSPSLPFLVGRITDFAAEGSTFFKHTSIVRRAQQEVSRSVAGTYMVSTDGLERHPDRIHFSSKGTYQLGRRFVPSSVPL